jgi:hypothetical protein
MATSSTFDPIKAAREELAGLGEVGRVLSQRERACEEAMAKAESELNAIRKITGYVRLSVDTIRQRIDQLELQQQNKQNAP